MKLTAKSIGVKSFLKVLILFGLMISMTSCWLLFDILFPDSSTDAGEEKDNTEITAEDEKLDFFWGTWIRMDTGTKYTINDTSVISGYSTHDITYTSPLSIMFNSSTLKKETQNTARLGDSVLLFRSGGSARSFSAMVSGFTESRDLAIGTQPLPGRTGRRTGASNASDTESVTSDADGILNFTSAVPETEQIISVEGSAVKVNVTPEFEGQFIGTIPIVTNGYSFKVKSTVSVQYAYGNSYDEYDFTVDIENIGTSDCETSTYEIVHDDPALTITGPVTGNFTTLEPGSRKKINFKVKYGLVQAEYKDVTLKILITDSSSIPRTWVDYVVLRFYNRPVEIYVNALSLDGSYSKVNGFLIYPDGYSEHFYVNSGNNRTLLCPWSESDYKLVFSGADAVNEMKYAFGVEQLPFLGGTWYAETINAFEPNNSELSSVHIDDPRKATIAYLKKSDIDFYTVNVDVALPELKYYGYLLKDDGNSDGKPNAGESFSMDMKIFNSGLSERTGISVILNSASGYLTITTDSYVYGNLPSGYFDTVYDTPQQYASWADLNASAPGCFAFAIAENTPVGTIIPITITFTDSLGSVETTEMYLTVQ